MIYPRMKVTCLKVQLSSILQCPNLLIPSILYSPSNLPSLVQAGSLAHLLAKQHTVFLHLLGLTKHSTVALASSLNTLVVHLSIANKNDTNICARLAQSVERKALNLVVVGSSPTVGALLFYIYLFLSMIISFIHVNNINDQNNVHKL
jgi:hypothetical protein